MLFVLLIGFDGVSAVGMAEEEATYYGLPWWRQLIWSILFVSMATTATCGNLIVIWIVMWHQRMRTVTNYFIGKRKSHNKAFLVQIVCVLNGSIM